MKKLLFPLLTLLIVHGFAQDFITRSGKDLMFQDSTIMLRGMAFGNLVWNDQYSPTQHHTEVDYERLNKLGMNAIRFYLSYKTFEKDSNPYTYLESGWNWIDQNIEWAKAHGIYLILNMHVPQGGFQSQCDGGELWSVAENQTRLAALWKEIANRYKDEPQIAGYDLLNEPIPTTSTNEWSTLAQRIIDSIRTVDNNHLIVTERAIALDCDYGYSDANNNYPQIDEENLMYTMHLYDPYEFTHQNLDWANTGDGGSYPDNSTFTLPGDLEYYTGNYSNPSISTGTTDWTLITGNKYKVSDDAILVGRIAASARGLDTGTAYFDDFVLLELNANNEVVDTIYDVNPTSGDYWWWSEDETGDYSSSTDGHNDNYSVAVSGNKKSITLIYHEFTFKAQQNMKYQVLGYIKGENLPAGATATFTTEFYHSPSGEKLQSRNYDYLEERIVDYAAYVEEKGFPVYFGEFGTARNTFQNNKGGVNWVSDAMQIFDSLGYHFTYHSYKESSFGYYDGWEKPIDTNTVNTELQELFTSFFNKSSTPTSTEELLTENNIVLSPNPAKNNIQILSKSTIVSVECYSSDGIYQFSSDSHKLDISALTPGNYYLTIYLGDRIAVRGFIKE